MLTGLMRDAPLTLGRLLRRMSDVTTSSYAYGPGRERLSCAGVAARARRLGELCTRLGIEPGDRVASLDFNTVDHLTVFLGVPANGVLLRSVNPRFTAEQVEYVLACSAPRALFVGQRLLDRALPAVARVPELEHVVVLDAVGSASDRVTLVDALADIEDTGPPTTDERKTSVRCDLSEATYDSESISYAHGSAVLHALRSGMTTTWGFSSQETILSIVPMLQAHAWGLPHAAALVGADLVLPGHDLSAAAVGELIRRYRVTMIAGGPTALGELLEHANAAPGILESLRLIVSDLQPPLVEGFARHGVEVIQGRGTTETSPRPATGSGGEGTPTTLPCVPASPPDSARAAP